MKEKLTTTTLIIAQLLIFALAGILWLSFGHTKSALALTVPTRTPVPPPGGSGGGGGGGGGSSSQPTDVPPTLTPTATQVPVTIAPTPIDGFITPEACGIPIFQAINGSVNVRTEPATDSPLAGQLVYLEARGISGQLADREWWLIVLPDSTQGWVANEAGTVFGNTAGVPVINAQQQRVDSGIIWQPTPNPACPTLTPTATPTETPTPLPPTATTTANPAAAETIQESPTATAEVEAALVSDGLTPTATPLPISEPADAAPAVAEAVPPEEAETLVPPTGETSGGPNFFLWGGLTLLLGGFAAYFVQNRRSNLNQADR